MEIICLETLKISEWIKECASASIYSTSLLRGYENKYKGFQPKQLEKQAINTPCTNTMRMPYDLRSRGTWGSRQGCLMHMGTYGSPSCANSIVFIAFSSILPSCNAFDLKWIFFTLYCDTERKQGLASAKPKR